MSFVHLAILPSALLAWPIYHWIGSNEVKSSFQGAIETCAALTLAIASIVALHRTARHQMVRDSQTNTSIVKFLANKASTEKMWLVLQPIVLAIACWPGFTSSLPFVQHSLSGQVLSFFLPSLLFLFCLHGVRVRWHWMALMPLLVMTAIAAACDGARCILAPSEWENDLWSISNVPTTTVWSTVAVVLVSGILASLWMPSWIVWCSGAEPLNRTKFHDGDTNETGDGRIRSIEELWRRIDRTIPSILLWPTNCRMSNAVIVNGLFRKKLLLTDRLMLRFTPMEIELIVLHELAHAIRWHSFVRLLPAAVTIPVLACAMTSLTGTALMLVCSMLAIAFPLFLIATCWWTEWDADKKAIELAIEFRGLSRSEARSSYALVVQKLYRDNGIRRSSWSHPSCEQRLAAFRAK